MLSLSLSISISISPNFLSCVENNMWRRSRRRDRRDDIFSAVSISSSRPNAVTKRRNICRRAIPSCQFIVNIVVFWQTVEISWLLRAIVTVWLSVVCLWRMRHGAKRCDMCIQMKYNYYWSLMWKRPIVVLASKSDLIFELCDVFCGISMSRLQKACCSKTVRFK